MKRNWIESSCLAFTSVLSLPAIGADFSISGFGTLGYARSDQPYNYQRFINDGGTFKRDSIAGIQIDAKFADRFGATMQVKEAPATNSDQGYQTTVAWAFLSYRPSNDWLLSAGKQRIPFYLSSQNYDIGVTYDFARLPTEMYSLSPSNDFNGVSLSKYWPLASGELSVDGYWGRSKFDARYWLRDGIPGVQNPGAVFRGVEFEGKIVVLSFKQNDDVYRIGVVRGIGRMQDGTPLPSSYPFVTVMPGVGYYQVNASMPGPGVGTKDGFHNTILTLGADVTFDKGIRATAELARTYVTQSGVDFANASSRGYVAVSKKIDQWTPYVSYAFLHSQAGQLRVYNSVNANTVPNFVPGAALINASQRLGSDLILPYDQHSWAIGTSYSFSASSKLKAELMRTRVGQVSSLVDGPPGSNIRNQNINVFSVSYNFVF